MPAIFMTNPYRYAAAGADPDPAFVQAGTPYISGTAIEEHSIAYTCAVSPGSNRLLVLALAFKQNADDPDVITYNGTAMTRAAFIRNTSSTPDTIGAIYYLLNADIPNDGASHNFIINAVTTVFLAAVPIEYVNIAQGAPHRTDTESSSGDGSIDLLTVAAGSLLVDCMAVANNAATFIAGTDQNERGEVSNTALAITASDKLPAAHSGGTVTMAQDQSSGNSKAYVAVAWEKAT